MLPKNNELRKKCLLLFWQKRAAWRSIMNDPRCTPAERLECIHRLEETRSQTHSKKPQRKRNLKAMNKGTNKLHELLAKVEQAA